MLFLIPPGVPVPTSIGTEGPQAPIVTPFNVGELYPGGKYIEGPTYAYYSIPGPPPGVWNFHLEGANTEPFTVPETLYFNLVATGNVSMDVVLAALTYDIGQPVTVTASLFQGGGAPDDEHTLFASTAGVPVENATVKAYITLPGSFAPDSILLDYVGSGKYRGTFTGRTVLPGSYDIRVSATGSLPDVLEPFTRENRQSIFVNPPSGESTIVLLGTRSVRLQDYSSVQSGDVLVNDKLAAPDSQLVVGSSVTLWTGNPNAYVLGSNSIGLSASAAVNGQIYANTVNTQPWNNQLDYFPLAWLPAFLTASPSSDPSKDFGVPNGSTDKTLLPGIYRDIILEPHSTLTVSGGVYHIRNLRLKANAKLLFDAASDLRISDGINADNGSVIGPSNTASSVSASDIVLYVGASDAGSTYSLAVTISPKSFITANIYAKNGTLLLDQETQATGAFLAKDILIGQKVTVSLKSAFTGMVPLFTASGGSLAQGGGSAAAASLIEPVSEIPDKFSIGQNYPNPFNPTTQIRYGLPAQASVKLTIHNLLGQEVATLVEGIQAAGYHVIQWNGTNVSGTIVGSGVYFFRIQAGDFVEMKKMILLK